MAQDKSCFFCNGPITEEECCSWCGFSQHGKEHLEGTLEYGTALNDYVIGDVISMDGESTSYIAYDRKNQKKVIIKEFLPVSMVAPRQNGYVKIQDGKEVLFKNLMMDFTDLYTTLSKIDSKSIPKIYKIFTANGTVYVALESIKGDTLKQTLIKRGKPYTFKEARWLFQDLFMLMHQLAQLNISHGGICDETVMVTTENTIVLTGFAIQDLRVKNEHIIYKLYDGFSAPEQYSNNQFQGFYTDIYSIAALLYYSVSGHVLTPQSLELKETSRLMPKYAVDALKYATIHSPVERIDNIDDFVLMLDNKAVIDKPTAVKTKEFDLKSIDKKYIPIIISAAVILAFFIAVFSLNGQREQGSSSDTLSISQSQYAQVPSLIGKSYNDIMNDQELNLHFYFVMEEAYSDKYSIGQVISHRPMAGEEVKEGTTIYLTVSKGQQLVLVPANLVGSGIESVKVRLDDLGIQYRIIEVAQSEQYRTGTVTGTDKPAGTALKVNSEMLILYVANSEPIPTPTPSPTPTPTPTPIPTPTPTPTQTPKPSPSPTPSESSEPSTSQLPENGELT